MRFDNPIPPAAASGIPSYTWVSKPTAASAGAGAQIRVTDVGVGGGSFWISDGTNWLPLNGYVLLKKFSGTVSSPAITYTGGTAPFQLVMPGGNLKLPAGILTPGSMLRVNGVYRRRGAASNATIRTTIGTGTAFDANARVHYTRFGGDGTSGTWDYRVSISSGNVLTSTDTVGRNVLGSPITDTSANVNMNADMFMSLEIHETAAADSVDIINLSVELLV